MGQKDGTSAAGLEGQEEGVSDVGGAGDARARNGAADDRIGKKGG